MPRRTPPLHFLAYPYTQLVALTGGRAQLRSMGPRAGSALVWSMTATPHRAVLELVEQRPGGVSLLVILPPAAQIATDPNVVLTVHGVRPHGVLPYHPTPSPVDLAQVLRRPPLDLGGEVTDYLRWRGLVVDGDTAHVVRRIMDLSAELRSISAVSRSMYLSRRALGRRLMSRGLPVPSHWLQIGRLLRVALRLQNTDATVSSVAFELGYPDGFSVSNQMERLVGHRPSEVREHLGWEWLLEAWLRMEAESGGLEPSVAGRIRDEAPPEMIDPLDRAPRRLRQPRSARKSAR